MVKECENVSVFRSKPSGAGGGGEEPYSIMEEGRRISVETERGRRRAPGAYFP